MSILNVMDQVHLAGEDEDDLYSGYNESNPIFDTQDLAEDPNFKKAVLRTSYGRRPPPTGMTPGTGFNCPPLGTAARGRNALPSSFGRPIGTAMQPPPQDGTARPMTAAKGAGYTSAGNRGALFYPANQTVKGVGSISPMDKKSEEKPEEKIKELEKKANTLIEESCFATSRGDFKTALEKAKEAEKKEAAVVRLHKQITQEEPINLDLTYSVLFNLGNVYFVNEMYTEAVNAYNVIVKTKQFYSAGRLKVNIGNIHFKQKNYQKAIKFYRMALDQVQLTHRQMKMKIMQNIGIAFVKMGKYDDAIESFENVMNDSPSFKTGFNLILCYFALNDQNKMKWAFEQMLAVDIDFNDEYKYQSSDNTEHNHFIEVIKDDALRRLEREKKYEAEKCIKTAAKIISPHIENSFAAGYDWCVDVVKRSAYKDLANDLEIDKAIMFLKTKDFRQAVETLKSFEKKDSKFASIAATNLSFLYFLERDLQQAERYADMAITSDRYNPAALVNKANVLYSNNEYEKAREYYQEALQNDSSCVEALYNLGLSNKMIGHFEESLDCFYKLHAILRSSPQVMYQIADLYDQLEEKLHANEWFMQLVGVVATDPDILSRLGQFYDDDGDKSLAFQYYYDSYRYFPSNIAVIEWLGVYYIESQFPEKAVQYFERAAIVQPNVSRWQLMVASSYRRSGNYQQALETYKKIEQRFPENIECLKFLAKICADLGLKEAQEYSTKLKKAEKAKEQRINSGSRRGSGRHREGQNGSAGSDRTSSGNSSRKSSGRAGQRMSERMGSGHRSGYDLHEEENKTREIDASYSDPLGPQLERPKTAARKKDDDDFADDELVDMLPM